MARSASTRAATPSTRTRSHRATSTFLFRRDAPTGPLTLRLDGRLDDREALLVDAPPEERQLEDEALLLARYRRLGERFLDGVRGAFAVVVLDPAAGRAIAARDAMGHRLASYVLEPDRFAVAIGQQGGAAELLAVEGVAADLDEARLAEYFAYDEIAGNASFFRHVRHVLPGEMLVVERSRVEGRWLSRPRLDLRLDDVGWELAVERLYSLLHAAVARVLRGRERAAVWVSGGLDSTPIAALAARILGKSGVEAPVQGISWRIRDAAGDESAYVDAFTRRSGVPVSWVDCDDALVFSDLAHWPVHPASPEQTAYRWFHQRSYARARELGHDLVLVGFGGDHLYLDARRWLWALLLGEGPGAAIDRLRAVAARDGWPRALRRDVVGALLWRRRRLRRPRPGWLTPRALGRLADRPAWPPDLEAARRPRQAERVLALLDAHGEHLEAWYGARQGIDVEMPLRDADLAQFLLAVPDHFVQQGVETRPLLREAIRGLVPPEVRLRRGKASFREVLVRGLQRERLGWAPALLRSAEAIWPGLVEASWVERWLAGELRDDWDRVGFLQVLHAELWRYVRGGGDLGALAGAVAPRG